MKLQGLKQGTRSKQKQQTANKILLYELSYDVINMGTANDVHLAGYQAISSFHKETVQVHHQFTTNQIPIIFLPYSYNRRQTSIYSLP